MYLRSSAVMADAEEEADTPGAAGQPAAVELVMKSALEDVRRSLTLEDVQWRSSVGDSHLCYAARRPEEVGDAGKVCRHLVEALGTIQRNTRASAHPRAMFNCARAGLFRSRLKEPWLPEFPPHLESRSIFEKWSFKSGERKTLEKFIAKRRPVSGRRLGLWPGGRRSR